VQGGPGDPLFPGVFSLSLSLSTWGRRLCCSLACSLARARLRALFCWSFRLRRSFWTLLWQKNFLNVLCVWESSGCAVDLAEEASNSTSTPATSFSLSLSLSHTRTRTQKSLSWFEEHCRSLCRQDSLLTYFLLLLDFWSVASGGRASSSTVVVQWCGVAFILQVGSLTILVASSGFFWGRVALSVWACMSSATPDAFLSFCVQIQILLFGSFAPIWAAFFWLATCRAP
jgi:hypothetical protein